MNAMTRGMVFVGLLASVTGADAGLLQTHFGVTPTLKQVKGDIYGFVDTSLKPTKTTPATEYTTGDWCKSGWGIEPSGGEGYDIEAMYYDRDANYVYIAVLLSMDPVAGITASNGQKIVPGDIAIDCGLNRSAVNGFRYDYAVNVSTETYVSNEDNANPGSVIGTGVYRTKNTDWYLGSPDSDVAANGQNTNFDPTRKNHSGSFLGNAINVTSELLTFTCDGAQRKEDGVATYALSMQIPVGYFSDADLSKGLRIQYLPGCRNDALMLTVDPTTYVPEPAAIALLASGAIAMVSLRRRSAN